MTEEQEVKARERKIRGNKKRGIIAVSYTHLRAHETVLDLVCRLLLEKKTNRKPTIDAPL